MKNREKFAEVFGFEPAEDVIHNCVGRKCTDCDQFKNNECTSADWWDKEYHQVTSHVNHRDARHEVRRLL